MTTAPFSWDERYRRKPAPTEPNDLLIRFSRLLSPGMLALDLACGAGRNSVWLAERGLEVVGIDRSREALEQARASAQERHVNVAWVQADLERFTLPVAAFDAILCFYYRDPQIVPALREAVRPGGLLFYETFTRDQLRFGEGPKNPAHLLEPGELLEAFGDWNVVFYRESWIERGVASLVARKPMGWGLRAGDSRSSRF